MPMRIRLSMHGRAHKRFFQLVAVNQRARRDAKPAEVLGIYNPHLEPGQDHKTIEWSVDRIRYWLHVGAVPSKSAVKLLELGNILKPGSIYHPKPRRAAPEEPPAPTLAEIRERVTATAEETPESVTTTAEDK
ncbi:ribosomal protein S16 domain-containing protein [Mycena rosella]|uniref:Ribosomal protein S16 domain-containing protein n=1 Tax=Mycena rosella TaxID=1033263 RepID=A0AAD7M908_MYCRO|nr:ribosomal protein S16 domain-containing protein [Mycena rosella]